MNSVVGIWISMVFTVLFLIFMGARIVKSIVKDEKAILGVVFSLDNLRYTTMFLSFILTEYFGILAGEKLLSEYTLSAGESFIAYSVVFAVGVFVSAVISTTLVQTERTLGEGNLLFRQFVTVMAVYLFTAGIDFVTLVGGFSIVANELESKKVRALKKDVDPKELFLIKQKQSLYKNKKDELASIDKQLASPSAIKIALNDKAKKLKKEMEWCKRVGKNCPTTKRNFYLLKSEILKSEVDKLKAKRQKVFLEVQKLLDEYERVSQNINNNKDKKLLSVKKTKEKIEFYGYLFAFGLILFNILASLARSQLTSHGSGKFFRFEDDDDDEFVVDEKQSVKNYEEIHDSLTPTKELSEMETEALVRDAMKEVVKEKGVYISRSDDVSKINIPFSRDAVRRKMQELIDDMGGGLTFKIANEKLMRLVKKYKPEVTVWAQENSWSWQGGEELAVA